VCLLAWAFEPGPLGNLGLVRIANPCGVEGLAALLGTLGMVGLLMTLAVAVAGGYLISGAFPSSRRSGASTTQVVCLLRRSLLRRLRHRSSVVVPARVPGNRVDLDSTFPARSEHHPGSGWDRDPALSPLRDRPPKYLDSGQRTLPSWSLRPAPGRGLRSRLPRPEPSRPHRSP
jgi:hypothetical protein